MRICMFILLASLIAPALPADPPRPIRVLIVDGFSNHDWRLTTRSIRAIVEPTGLFTVDVSTSPPAKDSPGWDEWRPDFSAYDVIVQHCNDINGGPSWPEPVRLAFEKFVRSGGGVYVWHSGNNAFAGWPEYNEMIGLGWRDRGYGTALVVRDDGRLTRVPPGEGESTGHGPRFARDRSRCRLQTLLIRGLQWLAKRPVDWPAPSTFPTARATSVGPPLE